MMSDPSKDDALRAVFQRDQNAALFLQLADEKLQHIPVTEWMRKYVDVAVSRPCSHRPVVGRDPVFAMGAGRARSLCARCARRALASPPMVDGLRLCDVCSGPAGAGSGGVFRHWRGVSVFAIFCSSCRSTVCGD